MEKSNDKREIQIVNDNVKKQYTIQDSDIGKQIKDNEIDQNFMKYTKSYNDDLQTNKKNQLDEFITYQNQRLSILKDNQNKIYNKLLWINIASDQIYKDQKEKTLLKNKKELQSVKDLQIQTNKVQGYSQNLQKRLNLLEENLDKFFFQFLKNNKEKLTSLENNQIIKK